MLEAGADRNGTANLFVFLDVHRPWRNVKVTERYDCEYRRYGTNLADSYRLVGLYAGRILKEADTQRRQTRGRRRSLLLRGASGGGGGDRQKSEINLQSLASMLSRKGFASAHCIRGWGRRPSEIRNQPHAKPASMLSRKGFASAHQARNLPTPGDRLCRVPPVFEGVLISLRCAGRHSAVHPTSAVRHRWRLARIPAPRSGSASRAEVHR
jgi:hypothetical protein